jgi:diguanylate cyclase (GGDEF)-like protein
VNERPVILLAEDSMVVRAVVRSQLIEHGFDVVEAEDGERAIEAFRECHPDVVLLDIEMPVLGGFEVLAAIKEDPESGDTPVVFLTAREATSDLIDALELGAHDYLRKPFDGGELLARVRAARRVKALQDELRIRNAELDRISRTDPLTGLWNRRHLQGQLPAVQSLAQRHGTQVSALMVDIDHFKRINDEEGHRVGDLVLQEVAARLRSGVRTEDLLARWGGEEFLVLLPLTGPDGAATVSERVRAAVGEEPVHVGGRDIAVTVSVGSASLQAGEDMESLVGRADAAMYEAKRTGRNRVMVAAG